VHGLDTELGIEVDVGFHGLDHALPVGLVLRKQLLKV